MTVSLSQRAYEHIQKQILDGELPAGSQLSEQSLAESIGVSRTPVREAIRRLVAEGLLEQLPRYGTIVRTPGRREIVELYEVREALESWAAAEAARRLGADDLDLLEKLCNQMRDIEGELRASGATLDAAGLRRFLAADMAFHTVLIRASGNRRILKIVGENRVLTRIFRTHRQGHDAEVVHRAHAFHRGILEALRAGDAEAASRRMAEHVRTSKQQALDAFDRREAEGASAQAIPLDLPDDLLAELNQMDLSPKEASA